MDLKFWHLLGLFYLCQRTCGNEPSSNYTNILSSTTSDAWLPMTNPTSYTITRLQLVNSTTEENDMATVFDIVCAVDENNENYRLEKYTGDIIVSFMFHKSDNLVDPVKFLYKRINELSLVAYNYSLGLRMLEVSELGNLSEIIENELDYLEHCTENPFGIFLSTQLWHRTSKNSTDYELKMWPLPNIERIKMQKVAHLLNELPLTLDKANVSMEIRADSIAFTNQFQEIMEEEGLCFKSFLSKDNVFVYIGNETFLNSVSFISNQSQIIIPLQRINLTHIPNETYIAEETKIRNISQPSTFISIAATFLEITNAVNKALLKLYDNKPTVTKKQLTKCEICNDLEVFGDLSYQNPKNILNILEMKEVENELTYILFYKKSLKLTKILSINYVSNETTNFVQDKKDKVSLGTLFKCNSVQTPVNFNLSGFQNHLSDGFKPNEVYHQQNTAINMDSEFEDMNWELKTELWVAIGLTMSTLGILLSMAILTFIIIRICMDDVLEGNPIGSIVMLIALIAQFTSFFPFTIEYVSSNLVDNDDVMNSMCIIKLFLVSVSYCLTFSLLLSRAIMLASIGSEGGFLSHVNGYIQSIICFFSFIVQLGLSIQLLIVMQANSKNVTCIDIYNGNWFWAVISYDIFILLMLVALSPFIFKSQRNYHEGVLIVITSVLCVICWGLWIPLSMIDDNFREIMISLGVQLTAWIILGTLMVPRCFLIVKSVARSDFTQALPSLTSLAFAQANQFMSDPSIYECVNPTMRGRSIGDESDVTNLPNESYISPGDVPTLPLRNYIEQHYNRNFNEIINPNLTSPNKMTRF